MNKMQIDIGTGEPILPALAKKYGRSEDEMRAAQANMMAIAKDLGVNFEKLQERLTANTFDAHRLLYWAGKEGKSGQQTALTMALFTAYFQDAENPSDHGVLNRAVEEVGLSPERAAEILASDEFAKEVRAEEEEFGNAGISSVPTYVVNGKFAISGGHPPEVFEQALSEIARQGDEILADAEANENV